MFAVSNILHRDFEILLGWTLWNLSAKVWILKEIFCWLRAGSWLNFGTIKKWNLWQLFYVHLKNFFSSEHTDKSKLSNSSSPWKIYVAPCVILLRTVCNYCFLNLHIIANIVVPLLHTSVQLCADDWPRFGALMPCSLPSWAHAGEGAVHWGLWLELNMKHEIWNLKCEMLWSNSPGTWLKRPPPPQACCDTAFEYAHQRSQFGTRIGQFKHHCHQHFQVTKSECESVIDLNRFGFKLIITRIFSYENNIWKVFKYMNIQWFRYKLKLIYIFI